MTDHNTLEKGRVVVYGRWTGTEYVEHQAFVRAIVGADEFHTAINLTYSNGSGAALPVNNVLNIEQLTGNDDYWRWLTQPDVNDSIPRTITRPVQGQVEWIAIFDATTQETTNYLCFVRAIPGAPTNPTPRLNTTYFDPVTDDAVNANNVDPYDGTSGDDYWFDQQ